MIPGQVFTQDGDITLNAGRETVTLEVANTATGFVDMNFAPERIVKLMARQGAALKARPEMQRHHG